MILIFLALAQQQLPTPLPPFRLQAKEFVQSGNGVSTLAFRADHEGGLDVTQTPCEGRYVLSFTERTPTPFHVNSTHTFLHKVELNGHIFDSDNLDPLVFRVDAEGYTWVRGKGNVTIPVGATLTSRGVTASTNGRTFLLPPGRQSAELPAIPNGNRILVCGRQLQISLINVQEGTTTVRFAMGSTAWPAAASTRVMVALLDEKGQRFKPKDISPLTWGNITQTAGIVFEIPSKPIALEIEGILVRLP